MRLSIVATLYQSQPYIAEFCERAAAAAHSLVGDDFEIVLVNDGSPDDSLQTAITLFEDNRHIKIVDLSRNFGHHKAMMTGLDHTCGDLVYLIDSDLEEQPEWIFDFSAILHDTESDVVFGRQGARRGGVFERISGTLFYSIFNRMTEIPIATNLVTARLMTRRYVVALLEHKEREVFLAGIWELTGFKQTSAEVEKLNTSPTNYSVGRRVALMLNSISSFSNRPLYLVLYAGLGMTFISMLLVFYTLYNWLFISSEITGWTSLIASIWLIGGLQTLSIGVIGIYMSKVFTEVKQRPYTIVRHLYEHDVNC